MSKKVVAGAWEEVDHYMKEVGGAWESCEAVCKPVNGAWEKIWEVGYYLVKDSYTDQTYWRGRLSMWDANDSGTSGYISQVALGQSKYVFVGGDVADDGTCSFWASGGIETELVMSEGNEDYNGVTDYFGIDVTKYTKFTLEYSLIPSADSNINFVTLWFTSIFYPMGGSYVQPRTPLTVGEYIKVEFDITDFTQFRDFSFNNGTIEFNNNNSAQWDEAEFTIHTIKFS